MDSDAISRSMFNPKRRYTAIAVFDEILESVVLIHKLRPPRQKDRANFPGGKLEDKDYVQGPWEDSFLDADNLAKAFRNCAARELTEETGLVIPKKDLKLFCTVRFKSHEGDDAEICYFCCIGEVDKAQTMERERIFVSSVSDVVLSTVKYVNSWRPKDHSIDPQYITIPTMPNLPWLTMMAFQALQTSSSAPPFIVYDSSLQP